VPAAPPPALRTERLLLRRWRDADRAPLAALHADPEVMRHFAAPLARPASDVLLARFDAHFGEHGIGPWAVEAPGVADLVGAVGLMVARLALPIASAQRPLVEIGWRLARDAWGRGYASEAARAALEDGFARLGLREVVAFTVPANVRSRAVMERLGMRHDPAGDFDHPGLPDGHALRRHVLYRLSSEDWRIGRAGAGAAR
jgi:RimJ/RimL family protein N-acetyltransferase